MGDRGRAGPAAAPVVVRAVGQQTLDPLYMALSLLRRRKFTEAVVSWCSQQLNGRMTSVENPVARWQRLECVTVD